MKSVYVQIGCNAIGETVKDAISEALEIEFTLNEKFDNNSTILQANNNNGLAVGESVMEEIRISRNAFLLKKYSEKK